MKTSIQTSLGHMPHLEYPKCGQKAILIFFGPSLVHIGPHLGQSWCGKWPKLVCSDVFIGVPTLIRPFQPEKGPLDLVLRPEVFVKANFGTFLAPIGPHLGHSGSGKCPKLVCLDVFIGVQTFLHPFQPKICTKS